MILASGNDMLNHIRSCGENSQVHGYLIHSLRFSDSETTDTFWRLQVTIVSQLRALRDLQVFIAIVLPDHDGRSVTGFVRTMHKHGWKVSKYDIEFPTYGDSIAGASRFVIGVHSSCATLVEPILLKEPPSTPPRPLRSFLWEPFNRTEYSVSLGKDDNDFCRQDTRFTTSATVPQGKPPGVVIRYYLHRPDSDENCLSGASVVSAAGLCPPFDACLNGNLFQHLFGIEFDYEGHRRVRSISPFEFARCFNFTDELTHRLSQPKNKFCLDGAIPGHTSLWLFGQIHSHLIFLRDSNCEIVSPQQYAAPVGSVQSFLNGAVGLRLPSRERWISAYSDDPDCCVIRRLILNPGSICKSALSDVHYCYRHPLRQSQLVLEDDMIIYREPIRGSHSFTRLQVVPKALFGVIFTAFHSNPLGGHFNAFRTLHRIRLRYFWPEMYTFVKKMCSACPGCALANSGRRTSSELVYHFPVEAPFRVLFVDAYKAGSHAGFDGDEAYVIACCGMTGFAVMEPVKHATSQTFAAAIMKIQLRFGLCHTLVLDKDSKFFGAFKEACDLLQINRHVLSGGNHNAMLVERVNRYLNKGLKVMTNERGSVRIAMEAILLLLYAWNSAPIPGTDLSRCFVALGREFQFPVDFSTNKHVELTSTPATITSYSRDLANNLQASHEIAKLLVEEQRAWHREYINARRPDPKIYSVGDVVFARRAVRSDASKGRVDKLSFAFTGPWRVVASLSGASYEIEHCSTKTKEKRHASDLSPYPIELLPLQPVDGADNQFSQINRKFSSNPYIQAGIQGFDPPTPFHAPLHFLFADGTMGFHWPTLAELNEELFPDIWALDQGLSLTLDDDGQPPLAGLYTGPPPAAPTYSAPDIPPANVLAQQIISSDDKLFFISHSIGSGDVREWRLVCIAFQATMSLYPSCLVDGRYLVDFYIAHPSDSRFNAINMRFWLQYHHRDDIVGPTSSAHTHYIRPSDTSDAYADRHHLLPYRKFINLTHSDTFIHGPFDFAVIHGRKSRDRVSKHAWDRLALHSSMFQNTIPRFDLPTYSIHVDRGAHTSGLCEVHALQLIASTPSEVHDPGCNLYPDKKCHS